MITDSQYLEWHQKVESNKFFRWFWVFFGIYSILTLFVVGGYLIFVNQYKIVTLATVALIIARIIISPLIYLFYNRQRPYQNLQFTPPTSWLFSKTTKSYNSFPSDHAISFSAMSSVLIYAFPFLAWVLLPVIILSGIARIILGYHYVSDVVGGWILGSVTAFLMVYYFGQALFTH